MKKRFIQVGCGGMGADWIKNSMGRLVNDLQQAQAAAVVDIVPDTFPLAMQIYQLKREQCYTDIQRAFDENEADFALIVTPPAYHEMVVDQALAHDMDILSEKPIADTMEASVRIYKKVTEAGKKMLVTMSHRFDQDKQTLEQQIKSGTYGHVSYIVGRNTWNCRRYGTWGKFRYEIPDPLLIEGTIHHFDIIRALTNANARSVYAVTWNPSWSEFKGDSVALITFEMENGVKVIYEGNKVSATGLNTWLQDYFRVECENATLTLDRRELTITSDLSGEREIVQKKLLQQDVWKNPWLAEMFVDWINGGDAPMCTVEDNIQCIAMLFAAIESTREGNVINVQDFLREYLS